MESSQAGNGKILLPCMYGRKGKALVSYAWSRIMEWTQSHTNQKRTIVRRSRHWQIIILVVNLKRLRLRPVRLLQAEANVTCRMRGTRCCLKLIIICLSLSCRCVPCCPGLESWSCLLASPEGRWEASLVETSQKALEQDARGRRNSNSPTLQENPTPPTLSLLTHQPAQSISYACPLLNQ